MNTLDLELAVAALTAGAPADTEASERLSFYLAVGATLAWSCLAVVVLW